MLTAEDRETLGIAPKPAKARRSSAVSQVLRGIHDDLTHGRAEWDSEGDDGQKRFRLLVASDRGTRRRAYALAYRVYRRRGYVSGDEGLIVSPYDSDPQTLTLLAQNSDGVDAATITVVFDSLKGLPSDEIYGAELNDLRARGRRLVEVTRLAIDEKYQCSRELLFRLFIFSYIFARRVKGFDDFVIEVNPRHVNYYRRSLAFEQAGPERPCPRVEGAPAVLLRLDFAVAEHEVQRADGNRTFYQHRLLQKEESAIAEFLAHSHMPMSEADAQHFGFKPPVSKVHI